MVIGWLIKRLRPWEGWSTFLLLLTTVLCLPAAAIAAEWVPKDEGWLPLAFVALLFSVTIITMGGLAENPWGRDKQTQLTSRSALMEFGLLLRRLKRL